MRRTLEENAKVTYRLSKVGRASPNTIEAERIYIRMGNKRSLTRLADEWLLLHPEETRDKKHLISSFEQLSRLHHWVDKATQYDLEKAEDRARYVEERMSNMNAQHEKIGQEGVDIAIERLRELMDMNSISANAAVSLLQISTEIQRRAVESDYNRISGKNDDRGIQIVLMTHDPEADINVASIESPMVDSVIVGDDDGRKT